MYRWTLPSPRRGSPGDVDPTLVEAISDAGLIGALIVAVVGGYRGWFVYGPLHDRIVRDLLEQRDFWRDAALRGTAIAEKAVEALPPKPDDE